MLDQTCRAPQHNGLHLLSRIEVLADAQRSDREQLIMHSIPSFGLENGVFSDVPFGGLTSLLPSVPVQELRIVLYT